MDNDMISGNHTCQSFVYMHVKNTFQKKKSIKNVKTNYCITRRNHKKCITVILNNTHTKMNSYPSF